MAKGSMLIDYLPFYDSDTEEFKGICEGEQQEFDVLWAIKEALLRESFAASALNNGLDRMEAMLGLNGGGFSTEERRGRIIFALMGDTPYTMNTLYKRLKVLFGNSAAMKYGREPYTLDVELNIVFAEREEELRKLLYRIVPANIGINIEVLYNTHGKLGGLRHEELRKYTNEMLKKTELKEGGDKV